MVELTVVLVNPVVKFINEIVFSENAKETVENETVALESGIVAPRSHSRKPTRRENESASSIRSAHDPMNALVSSLARVVSSLVAPSRHSTRFRT